ncbi:MAG: hypothetical protein IPK04_10435 [Bdellovibrionales bacterium]|nr:hypothetical protein [Bdellovibrionales bacterium]
MELQAQVKIFQFHFSQAIPILNQVQEYLKNQNGSYSLFVEKWLAICFCFQNKNSDSLQSLKLIKKKSAELGNWESARECDLFEAIATDNQDLAKKVLLGTPHESYRQRIRRLYGKNIVSRGNFYLNLDGNGGPNPTKRFNPYESYNQSEALFKKPLLLSLL